MSKIIYNARYSDTDKLDKFGRWARTASYNGIRIAWIGKTKSNKSFFYMAILHFPTLNNDTATEHKIFYSLDEAKEFVNEKWNWFIEKINE